jgi:hypothetical protein
MGFANVLAQKFLSWNIISTQNEPLAKTTYLSNYNMVCAGTLIEHLTFTSTPLSSTYQHSRAILQGPLYHSSVKIFMHMAALLLIINTNE